MSKITMTKLESGMCRWPIGSPEDKDFHFCGDPSEPSLPYCQTHMEQARAPTRKPKSS